MAHEVLRKADVSLPCRARRGSTATGSLGQWQTPSAACLAGLAAITPGPPGPARRSGAAASAPRAEGERGGRSPPLCRSTWSPTTACSPATCPNRGRTSLDHHHYHRLRVSLGNRRARPAPPGPGRNGVVVWGDVADTFPTLELRKRKRFNKSVFRSLFFFFFKEIKYFFPLPKTDQGVCFARPSHLIRTQLQSRSTECERKMYLTVMRNETEPKNHSSTRA